MVMRLDAWNVLSLLQAGNINIIAEEAERYSMDVIVLQEIRWKGKGSVMKSKLILHYS
jgi:exonuclease III